MRGLHYCCEISQKFSVHKCCEKTSTYIYVTCHKKFHSQMSGKILHRIGWLTNNYVFPSMPMSACHCTGLSALLMWSWFCIQLWSSYALRHCMTKWMMPWDSFMSKVKVRYYNRYWLLFDFIIFLLFFCYISAYNSIFLHGCAPYCLCSYLL